MGLLDRLSGGSRRRQAADRDHAAEVAQIHELAHTAPAHDEEIAAAGARTSQPSAAERDAQEWDETLRYVAGGDRRPFPFTPTHEYLHEVLGNDGAWRTGRDEFMVVDRLAYTRESWDRGSGPDLVVNRSGAWWLDVGGPAFEPDDMPTALPWRYVPWRDETGAWNTLAVEDEVSWIPRKDERSTAEVALDARLPEWRDIEGSEERVRSAYGQWPFAQEPVDLEDAVHVARGETGNPVAGGPLTEREDQPAEIPPLSQVMRSADFVEGRDPDWAACEEEDRMAAGEAQREAEWAARERAAQVLDRLAERDRPSDIETAPQASTADPDAVQRHPHALAADLERSPSDMDVSRSGDEHDLGPELD